MGTKQTESADDGSYSLDGVGSGRLVVVADSTDGRSQMSAVAAGTVSATVDLVLQAPGALEGKVTSAGAPLASVMVMASAQQAGRGTFMVRSGDDGTYHFDKLTPDTYTVSVMTGDGMFRSSFEQKTATVQTGQTVDLDIDVPSDGVTVTVKVTPAVLAQVFLVSGQIAPQNAGEILDLSVSRGAGSTHPGFAMKDQPATIDKVQPGPYTLCAIPIPGDINDMSAMQNLRTNADKLAVYCAPATINPDPATQTVGITVQPAAPLPP
jgi:hypothetical protein